MNNLNFITDGTLDHILDVESRRNHREEVLRECLRHSLKHALDYADAALDHCRDLKRARFDVSAELNDTETMLKAFLCAVLTMKREQQEKA